MLLSFGIYGGGGSLCKGQRKCECGNNGLVFVTTKTCNNINNQFMLWMEVYAIKLECRVCNSPSSKLIMDEARIVLCGLSYGLLSGYILYCDFIVHVQQRFLYIDEPPPWPDFVLALITVQYVDKLYPSMFVRVC